MRQLITGIIIALVAVVFALQNSDQVTVGFLAWTLPPLSMALILLITLIVGLIAGMLFLAPGIYKRNKVIQSQRGRINTLETEISRTAGNKPI
jgi:putative membrane protein